MSEYTPSTDDIESVYVSAGTRPDLSRKLFRSWLSAHDAEVRAADAENWRSIEGERAKKAEAERDALAAKLAKVREWLGTEDDWADDLEGSWPAPIELKAILDDGTQPLDSEAER